VIDRATLRWQILRRAWKVCPGGREERGYARFGQAGRLPSFAMQPTSSLCVPIGTVFNGKYRILSELGAGGFGRVFAAENINLKTMVALKVRHKAGPDERVWREARAAARLRCPYSVRVLDVDGLPDGTPYIVMELLDGQTLRQYLNDRGCVPLAQAVTWMLQLCAALEEAHAQNLVHRDITPSNVFLVVRPGHATQVKLLDFGLAKALDGTPTDHVTESGMVIGSPAYMSPEQLRGGSVTSASDIWSMGVLFYEMLSGSRPFRGDRNPAVLAAIAADPPIPIHEVVPDVPPAVARIVGRCLRKSTAERFTTVEALARHLQRLRVDRDDAPLIRLVDETGSHACELTEPVTVEARRRRARLLGFAGLAAASAIAAGAVAWHRFAPRTPAFERTSVTSMPESAPATPSESTPSSGAGPTPEANLNASRTSDSDVAPLEQAPAPRHGPGAPQAQHPPEGSTPAVAHSTASPKARLPSSGEKAAAPPTPRLFVEPDF
jgi:serine/threonine protein kinase